MKTTIKLVHTGPHSWSDTAVLINEKEVISTSDTIVWSNDIEFEFIERLMRAVAEHFGAEFVVEVEDKR